MLDPDLTVFFESMLDEEDKYLFELLSNPSIENAEIVNLLISTMNGGNGDNL